MFAFALPRKTDQVKYALKYTKTWKDISDIINHKLKKHYQILIIFWSKYLWDHCVLNDCLSSHLTQLLLLHYLGENRPSKSCAEMNKKNFNKFYQSRSLAPNRESITRFDCHKAVCLPDNVQKCLWIQGVTGELWISLKQNIIDTAVNE